METLKMHETFIHILKENAITYSTDRKVKGVCSLFFFHLTQANDTHPNCWEIHPDGDELLLVTKGEVEIEMVTQLYQGEDTVPGDAEKEVAILHDGELLIIPKGHWHRIILKKETDLVVATFGGNSKLASVEEKISNKYDESASPLETIN
ncbi:MAG TPA: cupin domain-containing protein [Mucilaginibacter sp.]